MTNFSLPPTTYFCNVCEGSVSDSFGTSLRDAVGDGWRCDGSILELKTPALVMAFNKQLFSTGSNFRFEIMRSAIFSRAQCGPVSGMLLLERTSRFRLRSE